MTDAEVLLAIGIFVVSILLIRGAYRRIAFTREERAFLALAANTNIPTAHAMDLINLARAKGTNVMQEVSADADVIRKNELAEARRQAAVAVLERAARDERRRLVFQVDTDLTKIEEINAAADAAGIAMLNRYVERGGPLAEDSPMGVSALQALTDKCNEDLRGIPEGEQYVTQVGQVARAMK